MKLSRSSFTWFREWFNHVWWIFSKAKPSQNAPVSGGPVLEKPIMLMKARDDAGKPGTSPEAAALSAGPGPSKMEKEGQRPTQPVYQIQNRGMGPSASGSVVDRELYILYTAWRRGREGVFKSEGRGVWIPSPCSVMKCPWSITEP